LDGHSQAFMAALGQEFRIRQGDGNNDSINVNDFLNERFPGTFPHGNMRERIPILERAHLIQIYHKIYV